MQQGPGVPRQQHTNKPHQMREGGQLLSWYISVGILLSLDHVRHVDVMNKMESAKKAEMMQGTSYYQNSVDFLSWTFVQEGTFVSSSSIALLHHNTDRRSELP
jgi:hypothetical protein